MIRRPGPAICGIAVLALVLAVPAKCEDSAASEPLLLDPIVVVASRLPQALSSVTGQVTVIDSAALQRRMAEDLDGVLRYQPGLEMETSGTRFGATGINIRGIGGNRVDIEIDGIPLRDQFSIGAYSNAGRVLVETDRVKRVEVLHGPASVMYGSNALGGVMAIHTWDPSDLLAKSGADYSLGLRGGYQGMDDSWVASAVAAGASGPHAVLAAATRREGHELDYGATTTLAEDKQDWSSTDYLVRYTWDTAGGDRLRLSASRWQRDTTTDIESLLGYGRRFRWTTSMQGDDHDDSRRFAADYVFSARGRFAGSLKAFATREETDQWTYERRAIAPQPVAIDRHFLYAHEQSGVKGLLFGDIEGAYGRHRLGLGAEWISGEVDELRDGLQTSLVDGSTSSVILGEQMPVRDFPMSRTDRFGVWLQDEIQLDDGRWEIIPGLRWDRYDLDPRPDAIWRADNPGAEVVSVSEDRVTPRLGTLFRAGEKWRLYGQYSEGFRAPPFEDANIGFEIPLFGFRAIPNPDLRSEKSQCLEFGTRYLDDGLLLSLAMFYTDYEDFIESRVLLGRDPLTGDLIFQSRNIDRAKIHGLDFRYEQDLSTWGAALEGWAIKLAAYWAEGENRGTGAPLNSIAPPQAVVGALWTAADETWDASVTGTFTAAKDASDIDSSDGERFATTGWATFDVTVGWKPVERWEFRGGVFNLTDRTYWRWLDVANLEADDPRIPLMSRPGRSYSLSARFTF
jgi:hemoglobin/transferrin/lactoferrin receptor protein